MSLTRRAMPSPNYSSRGGSGVRLIVVHTAEGARTIEELGNFFANPSSGVSSHVGIDDKKGVIGEYVRPDYKAWTQGNANPVAVSVELCAFAEWSAAEWAKHPNMLDNCARWIAEEAKRFGLPIDSLSDSEAQGSGRGECQHENLGAWGGGHWDCGGAFPMGDVLSAARSYMQGEEQEVDEMGYPPWFWDWANWYLTTDRAQGDRPDSAPDDIPQWAWDGIEEIQKIGKRYGMTAGERDWIDWYISGKRGERPDVPQDIPDRWWDDEKWALANT